MAEDSLRRFHRLAHFSEQRCVGVPEGMPRHSRQFQPVTGWCKFAVVQIFRTEWRPFERTKSEVVWLRPSAMLFVRSKYVPQRNAHWNYPMTAACLGGAELPI
jgi:hypothetical protein